MSNDKSGKTDNQNQPDTEEALEAELQRESGEAKGAVGDVASNRNLAGSSSWDTLPESEKHKG